MPIFQGTLEQWNSEVLSNPTYALIKSESFTGNVSGLFYYMDTARPSGQMMRDRVLTECVTNA